MGKLVQVAREALDLSKQRKRIAEAKLSLGSGSQLMLMQSTVDLNADSTRLIQQLVLIANLKTELNRLLGRDVQTPFEIRDTITHSGIGSMETIFRQAINQNSELNAARLNQDIARLGVNQAQSDRYPQINLNAGYNYNTLTAETGFLQSNRSYGPSFGISLTYNLFNGFNVARAIKNAKVMLNSGELEVEDTELMLKSALMKLQNAYIANMQIVELQHTNVQVARENVNIAFEKYKLGSINDIELREIQRKLIEAESQLITSQYEVKKAEIEISRYCGELLANIKVN
jgi:outer membrane protein TolC